MKGKKNDVMKFLLAEEANLIDLHQPVLNGTKEIGEIHDRLLEKHGWRFGIIRDYRKKLHSDTEFEIHPDWKDGSFPQEGLPKHLFDDPLN